MRCAKCGGRMYSCGDYDSCRICGYLYLHPIVVHEGRPMKKYAQTKKAEPTAPKDPQYKRCEVCGGRMKFKSENPYCSTCGKRLYDWNISLKKRPVPIIQKDGRWMFNPEVFGAKGAA